MKRQGYIKKGLQLAIPVTALLSLQGCGMLFGKDGYFRDRGDDYVKAKSVAPIRLPEGIESQSIGELFVIPPIADPDAPAPDEFQVPRPILDAGANARNEVKIQKLGERRWISVNTAPSAVWPRLRAFLVSKGINLAVMDPTMGMLETDWLTIKDDPGRKDRYRIQLEQGLRADTTEVHVLQLTVSDAVPAKGMVNWPAQSVNSQREQWMVSEIASFLAQEETTQASMLAQAIGTGANKVELVLPEDGSQPSLLIHLDYQRAWASVGGAASRNGFHVDDMNRDAGEFLVSFSTSRASADMREEAKRKDNDEEAPPQQEPGIFSSIGNTFGMGKDDKEKRPDDEEYLRLRLLQDDDGVRVNVLDAKGNALDPKAAAHWLRMLRPNLV